MASSHCWESPPALNPAGGVGEVVDDFGGLKAYVAGSAESKVAVILVSDIFGYEAPKLRKIADNVALSGYLVVVPDFLHGDPFDPSNPNNRAMWLQAHSPQKASEEAKPAIAALKEKGVSTIGAAGYCWGAKVVVELAKVHEIQAAVLLHPSLLTVDDIKEIKCPISILGAEIDKASPPELLKEFEQILSANSGNTVCEVCGNSGFTQLLLCCRDSKRCAVHQASSALATADASSLLYLTAHPCATPGKILTK